MAEFVVLRVRDPAAGPVEWITVDDSGACISEVQHGGLSEAAESAAGNRILVLVPSLDILRTETQIPIRNTAKLLKALPFAMEEQVAGDIEGLHFAVGQREPDGALPVAAVQRSILETWIESLNQVGLKPAGIYGDGDSLGDIPGTSILLVESDRVTLRYADGSVAAVDRSGLDSLIDLWLAGQTPDDDETKSSPVNLLVYASPDAQDGLAEFAAGLQPSVDMLDVKVLADGALPRMAANIVVNRGINLLQGDFAPRSNIAAYWPAWRLAAILLVCLTVTFVGVKVFQIVQQNRQVAALDAAIEQAFRYTFPDVREIRDPRGLLQSKLRELGASPAGADQSQFLDTLRAISEAVAQQSSVNAELETINYRSGVMELRLLALNVESLDTIQKAISSTGNLEAEIQSANPEGDKVLGRLLVKPAGA